MIPTYVSYRNTIDNMSKTVDSLMKQPQVDRETDYYTKNIKSVTSLDDFLADDRLYNYAMKAWGLEEMAFAKGMIKKILSDSSFASKMTDKKYRAFAEAFDFSTNPEETSSSEAVTTGTVNKYLQQTLEEQVGESNEGARLALYFTRTVGGMVQDESLSEDEWAYQILSDKALTEVVFTAFNIPQSVRMSDVDAQKRMLESLMSYEDLQDAGKLEDFITRFSTMYDLQNQVTSSPALTLIQSANLQSSVSGLSADTMVAIQNLKSNGGW